MSISTTRQRSTDLPSLPYLCSKCLFDGAVILCSGKKEVNYDPASNLLKEKIFRSCEHVFCKKCFEKSRVTSLCPVCNKIFITAQPAVDKIKVFDTSFFTVLNHFKDLEKDKMKKTLFDLAFENRDELVLDIIENNKIDDLILIQLFQEYSLMGNLPIAERIASKICSDVLKLKAFIDIAETYIDKKAKFDQLERILGEIIRLTQLINYKLNRHRNSNHSSLETNSKVTDDIYKRIIEITVFVARGYFSRKKNNEALEIFYIAEKNAAIIQDERLKNESLETIANGYFFSENLSAVKRILNLISDDIEKYKAYLKIAQLMIKEKKFDHLNSFLDDSLIAARTIKNVYYKAIAFQFLAKIYRSLKKLENEKQILEELEPILEKGMKIAELFSKNELRDIALGNIAIVYFLTKRFGIALGIAYKIYNTKMKNLVNNILFHSRESDVNEFEYYPMLLNRESFPFTLRDAYQVEE